MLYNNKISINGRAYDWGSILIAINGAPVIGVSNISFSQNQNTQMLFGTGLFPVHIGYGKMVSNASITLHQEEIFTLQNLSRDGIIQNIPFFDIFITYSYFDFATDLITNLQTFDNISELIPDANLPKTITLKNCRFINNGQDISQNDMKIEYKLDLALTHIKWEHKNQLDFTDFFNERN